MLEKRIITTDNRSFPVLSPVLPGPQFAGSWNEEDGGSGQVQRQQQPPQYYQPQHKTTRYRRTDSGASSYGAGGYPSSYAENLYLFSLFFCSI